MKPNQPSRTRSLTPVCVFSAGDAEKSWHGSFRKPQYGLGAPLMTAKSEYRRALPPTDGLF